jgi:hypothetical protein
VWTTTSSTGFVNLAHDIFDMGQPGAPMQFLCGPHWQGHGTVVFAQLVHCDPL